MGWRVPCPWPRCREISILAAADHDHRSTAPRRFRDRELDIRRRDHLEAVRHRRRRVRRDENDCHICAVALGFVNQSLDQYFRMTFIAVRGVGAHRANSADAHASAIERAIESVSLCAGQHFVLLHQGKSTLMTEPPDRLSLGRVKFGKG